MGKQLQWISAPQGDETDCKSRQQLQQHFKAFMHLCTPHSNTFEPLTEDLIKSTHGMQMKDLVDDGNVNAGVFCYYKLVGMVSATVARLPTVPV